MWKLASKGRTDRPETRGNRPEKATQILLRYVETGHKRPHRQT